MLNCPCGLNRGELTENNLVDHNNQKCKALYNLNENEVVCGMLFTAHPPPPARNSRTILSIPLQIPWSQDKVGNQLSLTSEKECLRDQLVDVERTINEAVDIIVENMICQSRVPPLAIVRMYRGGKTTVLKLLFDAFSIDNNNTYNIFPIIVSLNGNFNKRSDESNLNAFIRLIASQFIEIDENENKNYVSCSQVDLLSHIITIANGRSIVLLVDELNKFGVPLDSEISTFLKTYFLDIPNRYLVFTSHVILDIDPSISQQPIASSLSSASYLGNRGSNRDIKMIHMPRSIVINELRKMSKECSSVTSSEVSLFAGIPSLLRVAKTEREMTPRKRLANILRDALFPGNNELRFELLRVFLAEVRSGDYEPSDRPRYFDSFADHTLENMNHSNSNNGNNNNSEQQIKICWPLCYIEGILHFLKCEDLRIVVYHLETFIANEKLGKDWELITVSAIYLRSLESWVSYELNSNNSDKSYPIVKAPFNINGDGKVSKVEILFVPTNTIDELLLFLQTSDQISHEEGVISILIPSSGSFQTFDIIVIYWKSTKEFDAIGCQNKLGVATISNKNKVLIPNWISQAILLRGNSKTTIFTKDNWIYYTNQMVLEMLGYSLSFLYPSNWEKIQEEIVEEG